MRYVNISEESHNALKQFGLDIITQKQNLKWDWIIAEGYDIFYFRKRPADSNIFVAYNVPSSELESEINFWKARSIEEKTVPWEYTNKPSFHPPPWWPHLEVPFLATIRLKESLTTLIYLDRPNHCFYIYLNLLP